MLGVEDVLCELGREEVNEQGLPPGFRFHPTDEELITFYLASKVFHGSFCGIHIAEIDLNRSEPWDLPEAARMGDGEWYFFSSRDRKYPTGLRTNRATGAGYWKATGKDREVYGFGGALLIGMKKTLVFYKGRAPCGHKTRWVMHEYRLHGHFSYRHNTSKEEWVICRIFHKGEKRSPLITQEGEQMSYIEGQHQLLEAPPTVSSSSSCKFIETPITSGHLLGSQFHQNPFLMPHQMNPFQPNPPTFQANMTGASSSSSLQLFKSLFSHQERTSLKQEKNPILVHNNQCTALEELPRTHNNEMKQNSVCNQQQFLSASFLEETLNNGSVDMSSSTSSIGFHHLMMTMMTTDAPHHPIAAPPESSWLV